MLELPEAAVVSAQCAESFGGKAITRAVAAASPHGFAFYFGVPEAYPTLLEGRTVGRAYPVAGNVELDAGGVKIMLGDGVNLRRIAPEKKRPAKHQLLLEFDDGSALACSVQMYGGLWAFPDGENDSPYYLGAMEKPSPLTDAFDESYFDGLRKGLKPSLSAKGFLATEQRIPGLGNGVLQDILFLSGVHPARPLRTLSDADFETLYRNVKDVLARMTAEGGRDTEKDLYGDAGGYRTLLSRKTLAYPCPQCGGPITRKAYMGGNVYLCESCQPLIK